MDVKERLGRRIKRLREDRDLTQDAVAAGVGVSQPVYCRWEKGQVMPDVEHVQRLGEFHEVPWIDLLKEEGTVINIEQIHDSQGIGHIEVFHAVPLKMVTDVLDRYEARMDRMENLLKQFLHTQRGEKG